MHFIHTILHPQREVAKKKQKKVEIKSGTGRAGTFNVPIKCNEIKNRVPFSWQEEVSWASSDNEQPRDGGLLFANERDDTKGATSVIHIKIEIQFKVRFALEMIRKSDCSCETRCYFLLSCDSYLLKGREFINCRLVTIIYMFVYLGYYISS